MSEKFDAIIIGTGQSGPALAARLTKEGMKTAIIERKLFGGTCVNVGCIPTKTLVASARVAYMGRRGPDFGVNIGGPITVDMKQVKARKDGIVRQSNEGVTNWLKTMENLTVYEGHGRFESTNTVSVNGDLLEAEEIILNVGGRASIPDMPGVNDVDYLTNSSVMEVDFYRSIWRSSAAVTLGSNSPRCTAVLAAMSPSCSAATGSFPVMMKMYLQRSGKLSKPRVSTYV